MMFTRQSTPSRISPYFAASAALRSEYERLAASNRDAAPRPDSDRGGADADIGAQPLSRTQAARRSLCDRAGQDRRDCRPIASRWPPINRPIEAVIRFELARFITDARSVLADGAAEKAALHRVYDMARG